MTYFSVVMRSAEIRNVLLTGALLSVAACAHADLIAALPVSAVVSAHHGRCPRVSNRVLGERAARLFSAPIPYIVYNCNPHSEADLLRQGCGRETTGHNTVFVTFRRIQNVRFVQDGYQIVARVRTFGEDWDDRFHRATLYFAGRSFPRVPPPPDAHIRPYRGPEMYGEFGVAGDPLGLADGECPS